MDGLEEEFAGQLRVIRVDVQTPAGQALGEQYDFRFTPTFIFFDAQGQEQWRQVGGLETQNVVRSLMESQTESP